MERKKRLNNERKPPFYVDHRVVCARVRNQHRDGDKVGSHSRRGNVLFTSLSLKIEQTIICTYCQPVELAGTRDIGRQC
jgi:hypothetical protein